MLAACADCWRWGFKHGWHVRHRSRLAVLSLVFTVDPAVT